MNKFLIRENKKTLAELKEAPDSLVMDVLESKKTLFITRDDENAAVIMDISKYESLINELKFLRDIDDAIEQYHKGDYVDHETAKKQILSMHPDN